MADEIKKEVNDGNGSENIKIASSSDSQHIAVFNPNTETIVVKTRELPQGSGINGFFQSKKIVKPTIDPYYIESLCRQSVTQRRAIELKAILVAGLGCKFTNPDKVSKQRFKKFTEFIKKPNDIFGDSFYKIVMNIMRMYSMFGYTFLQINKALDVVKIYAGRNVKNTFIKPKYNQYGPTLYIDKYIQLQEKSFIAGNSNNGTTFNVYDGDPKSGISYMHMFGYKYMGNSYYPEPEYAPAIGKIVEDIKIDLLNDDFFTNRAIPATVFTFTGTRIGSENQKTLEDNLGDKLGQTQGLGNFFRSMVLSAPGKDAKIAIHDLMKQNDGQYSERQEKLESAIARANGVLPKLLQITTKGGSGFQGGSAVIGELFLENQILMRPLQAEIENEFNMILESIFGFNPGMKFNVIDTNNQKDMATIANLLYSGKQIGKKESRRYISSHGIIEIDPEEEQTDYSEDENSGTNLTIEGEPRNSDADVNSNPDEINTIAEDKFDEE